MKAVRTGLLGLRFGAGLAVQRILNTENEKYIQLTCVCDMDRALADRFASEHALKAYYSLDEMLKDADIEAVMIFTAPAGRAALMRQCLRANKHILTTKPFELDHRQALEVLKEAEEKNLVIHLNSPAPYPSGDLAQIRAWQKEYALGMPVAAYWETYVSYHEKADGKWFDDPEKCPAAPLFRLGIYGINELIALFGKVDSVELAESRLFTGRPTPDNAALLIRFASGAIGQVFASFCIGDGTLYPSALTLHFQRGTIRKMQMRTPDSRVFTEVRLSLQTVQDGKLHEEKVTLPASVRSGEYEFEMFQKAIRREPLPEAVSPEITAEGIRVINMMSAKEKELIAKGEGKC